jgi:hypothetical protein
MGQKRTWRNQIAMSALAPKADIRERALDVRFGPEADIEPPLWRRLVPEASSPSSELSRLQFRGSS